MILGKLYIIVNIFNLHSTPVDRSYVINLWISNEVRWYRSLVPTALVGGALEILYWSEGSEIATPYMT